mgnify:CR=1 FL=1
MVITRKYLKHLTGSAFLLLLMMLHASQAGAQEMPPRPVSGGFVQNMAFGAFAPGVSGGTVSLTPQGMRYSTGSIILVDFGYLYYPAIIELSGNPGTILHLVNGPDATLTGSNGGYLTMTIGQSLPGDPIILNADPPAVNQVRIGGTLTVGSIGANPAGFYTGSFSVMVVQE